jgi:LPXTG-motif cell wall-anchored protein
LQPRAAKDSNIVLSKNQLTLISASFLFGLPLLLAGMGGYLWWRRRRT